MKVFIKYLLIPSALLLLLIGSGSASLIANGSFEDGNPTGESWTRLNNGDTSLTGWSIGGDGVDWHNHVQFGFPPDGDMLIDLNLDGGTIGTIFQEFTTTPGITYALSFYLAGPGKEFGFPDPRNIKVNVAGGDYIISQSASNYTDILWGLKQLNFQAVSNNTTLTFSSVNSTGIWGPILDKVIVEPVAFINEYTIPTINSHPMFIDVDSEGRVWFTEQDGKKIGRFNPKTETFIEYPTDLKPRDIVYNVRDRSLYFLEDEYLNGHYAILDTKTGAVHEFPTELPAASAVDCTVDPSGNFWFNGWDSRSVSKVSRSGLENYIPPSFGYMSGLTQDPQGNIWLTIVQGGEYNPRLLKLDTNLAQAGTSNGFTEIPLPISQATIRKPLAALGKIWFWNESKISCYDPATGLFDEYPTTTPNAGISDLAADRWGRIWFTESAANQIGMLDLRAGIITEFPIPTAGGSPVGIAVDVNRDIIWFTESSGNKIGKLTLSDEEQYQQYEGDFDGDGDVDGDDLSVFINEFGQTNHDF